MRFPQISEALISHLPYEFDRRMRRFLSQGSCSFKAVNRGGDGPIALAVCLQADVVLPTNCTPTNLLFLRDLVPARSQAIALRLQPLQCSSYHGITVPKALVVSLQGFVERHSGDSPDPEDIDNIHVVQEGQ